MVKNKIRFDSMIHSSPTYMVWHGRTKSQNSSEPKSWSTKVERNIAVQCTGHHLPHGASRCSARHEMPSTDLSRSWLHHRLLPIHQLLHLLWTLLLFNINFIWNDVRISQGVVMIMRDWLHRGNSGGEPDASMCGVTNRYARMSTLQLS